MHSEANFHELVNQLVATRNLFAYLFGRPTVCLEAPLGRSFLGDFMDRMDLYVISANRDIKSRPSREHMLRKIEAWVREKELDDVRKAPHRIIDVLVVSERFQWPEVYTEAFTHGAGRYNFLKTLPDIHMLSPLTRQLLERASFDINSRVRNTEAALSAFKFPGILELSRPKRHQRSVRSSDSTFETPPAWRRAYLSFRKWTMAYYTDVFRVKSWPPARFTRGMILQLHNDFQALYELLVDDAPDRNDPYRRALERVLADFDAAVEPIPLPRLPQLPAETSPQHNRRQSRDAISVTLLDSYNLGAGGGSNRFVEAFKEFERAYGTERTVTKSVEAREGRWCLVFAVQATLRSVFDGTEGLKYRWGVEYWLCADLKGVPAWALQRSSGGAGSVLEAADAWEEGGSDLSMASAASTATSAAVAPAPRPSVFG